MAGCLISLVTEIGKCIWPELKSHVDYWWCFDDNIQQLTVGIEKLEDKKSSIAQDIVMPRRRNQISCPEGDTWLNASTEKLEEARRILTGDNNIPRKWNLPSRYSLGKIAKETADEITTLLNEGQHIQTAYPTPPPAAMASPPPPAAMASPPPPAAMVSPPHRSSMDFESRKGIEEDIIKSLTESSVSIVGICGMGGVGKTTMAKRIWERVKDENLFDEVVMVTVSQKIDMLKIQEEIAEWLELKLDGRHMAIRADKLRTRLMDTKRKIIILDDVWESLRFDDLGIPIESNFERCKVLLTSRSIDTCKPIKNKKVFELKSLEEKEAWILFKEKAGECVEDSVLSSMAKDVVAECKGLPIALVTVGLALQDDTNIHKWKDSLSQLRKSNPTNIEKALEDVYNPLKLSYDYLDKESEKYLFLLCCLFPEDHNIPVEQLTWYSMGLRLFDDITKIEEAINRTHTLVEKLKSRFLLIAGWDKLHVKMHDVVRDVAIYIGSKEKNGFLKSLHGTSIENSSDGNCNWMSVDISMEAPAWSRFPKLRILMMQNSKSSSTELSDISFEGMKDLNVLNFERLSIGSLPPTLGSLENLQMLRLFHCQVQNISVIGKLTTLKILNCYGCANIMELPEEIRSLSDLRLLELSDCKLLQTIPFGVISSLCRLEELKMRGSFSRWEAEENGKERRNASLTELECLPNLSCLEIEIDDCTLSALSLSLNLVKYYIRIGSRIQYFFGMIDDEKAIILTLPNRGAVGKWIQRQVRNTEGLYLEGDGCGSNNFNIAESENLRNLGVTECSTLNKLVETKECKFHNLKSINIWSCPELRSLFPVSVARRCLLQLEVLKIDDCDKLEVVFWNEIKDDNTNGCIELPKLKELKLRDLPNLTDFCQGLEKKDVSFCNLKSIEIGTCRNLRSLFSVSAARRCLLQLEVLQITYCESMEQVFWNEIRDDSTDGCIEFSKLKELTLRSLPNLTALCQGLEDNINNFPNLTEMRFGGLPRLKYSVLPLSSEIPSNLKSIKIESFSNLKHLFSGSGARTIRLQLEVLEIEDCESMEQVFWNEGTDDNTDGCIEFPKLKNLRLSNLQNLTAFCQGIENIIKFPNLTGLTIAGGLQKLNSLSPLNSETLDHTTSFLHFVCNPKVEMCCLKDLVLSNLGDNIRNIWCHQIPNNVFKNFESLNIFFINGIKSLMSPSIAKNLVSLKHLNIILCEEIVEVIERDDDDKQVVDICLFPNLRQLIICKLPKLIRFWQWNHALELPLLEEVGISDCPVMETFTLGSINTPNMRKIEVNDKKIDDQKDLNDVIRHIWIESQDTSKAYGDRNENEDKNESEDEYNNENVNKDEDSNEKKENDHE